jgi:hypothetical protein
MPELKRYRCTASGGYELQQTEEITTEQQQQIIAYFSAEPTCKGFFRYGFKLMDGTDSEGFTSTADLLGYINANHQKPQPIEQPTTTNGTGKED